MGVRWSAFGDLCTRYASVFRHAWRQRKEDAPPQRLRHEADFLPATLALQETPVHPAPRIAMGLILLFALLALLWAVLGRMDVVASASGKIILDDRSKLVQPMETGTIRAIHVRDGQTVRAGETLIELDSTDAQADIERLGGDLQSARIEAFRNRMLLAAQAQASTPDFGELPEGLDAGRAAGELTLVQARYEAYTSSLDQIDAEIARREAERRTTLALVEKLRHTLPIVRQREADYRNLREQSFVSKHGYLELEQARIEQERELIAQQEKLSEILASRVEAEQQKAHLVAQTRQEWLDRMRESEDRAETFAQELVKAQNRGRLQRLVAPADGVVQQLAVHTVGGVVTPAQPLMVIVPQDHPLEVEAFVPNKDIGFVRQGQNVEVKVETFAFTKYGTIDGEVVHVSSDAIQDEKLGLIFAARVRLGDNRIVVDGRPVRLSPGMAVTVEIKTGSRRVIEYFLGPLLQYADESLRER